MKGAREIARAKQHYPEARWLGIADGAASNWTFLEEHTERQLIDFFHATEYIAKLARARYPQRKAEAKRAAWQHAHCNRLKRDPGVLDELVAEVARLSRRTSLSQKARDDAYSPCCNTPKKPMTGFMRPLPRSVPSGLPMDGSAVSPAV